MEAAGERHDIRTPCDMLGQLDCALNGFRATVGKEEAVQSSGHNFDKPFRQTKQRFIHNDAGWPVQQAISRILNCLYDLGVAVSGVGHGDAGGEVQIFFAVKSVIIAPFLFYYG